MKRPTAPFKHQHYDLLICGGGIYGAWTAYDAALRGLKVMLVEQGDWASGTSSASSKLIHGGLRYLETLDIGLVKKSLTERQRFIDSVPYRVWPIRFGVPVNRHSRIGALRLKAGLMLYDFLAGIFNSQQAHQYFNSQDFSSRFPYLDNSDLICGYSYLDAQTDDARLVLEIIAGAQSAGATCLNYCQMTETLDENGALSGAVLSDNIGPDKYIVNASAIVKTTGQWHAENPPERQWCRLSKGVHLILPKVLEDEALLITAKSDGRVFFIIPWYGKTLLGTTDTNYKSDVNCVNVEKKDIDYLLSEANLALSVDWSEQDIQGQFAGLRVLQTSTMDSPSKITRDWELKSTKQGLFHSIGGKITSSREDAAQIVDSVCNYLDIKSSCQTSDITLPWKPQESFNDWSSLMSKKAQDLGVDSESSVWLLRRHGSHVAEILNNIEQDRSLGRRLVAKVPLIVADFNYCLENEMVCHLEDLLRRRIPLIILHRMRKDELVKYAEICAKTLGWDQAALDKEVESCAQKWLLH